MTIPTFKFVAPQPTICVQRARALWDHITVKVFAGAAAPSSIRRKAQKASFLRMAGLACLPALFLSGCSTQSRTVALAEVERLCATEAFYKVYKSVELPACSFGKDGNALMWTSVDSRFSADVKGTTIKTKAQYSYAGGTSASSESIVRKTEYKIVDAANQTILGEAIEFCGSGPVWLVDAAMSGRCCPSRPIKTLTEQVLRKGGGLCQ